MKNIFAALAALGTLAVGVSYSPSIATGATNAPVAVSWFLFSVASTLSFFTAWSSGRRSFSENPMNSVDLVITWGILLVIIFLGRDVRWTYNPVEVGCLVASGIVGIWWRTSKKKGKDVISNLAIQAIMTIAYLPLFYKLYIAERNTESFPPWTVSLVTAMFGIAAGVLEKNALATVYASRAFSMVTITLALMWRASR